MHKVNNTKKFPVAAATPLTPPLSASAAAYRNSSSGDEDDEAHDTLILDDSASASSASPTTPQTTSKVNKNLPDRKLTRLHFAGITFALSAGVALHFQFASSNNNNNNNNVLCTLLFSNILVSVAVSLFATWFVFLLVRYFFYMTPPQRTIAGKSIRIDPRLTFSAMQIASDLRAGKYTSVDICTAFINHIERIEGEGEGEGDNDGDGDSQKRSNRHINAVVFKRYDTALREAAAADELLDAWRLGDGPSKAPPLLCGVPCSNKETYALEGAPCSSGHPRRCNVVSERDCAAVMRYRRAGAIILCCTSTSELCMWLESSTTLHGTTANPYDASRIVGGSSGGEAAAISSCMAPFGLGGDFGSSLRNPAHFNGIFTIKPSTLLVDGSGQYPAPSNKANFVSSTGPFSRHASDLYHLLKILSEGGNGISQSDLSHTPCPPLRDPALVDVSKMTVLVVDDWCMPGVSVDAEQKRCVRVVAESLAANVGCKLKFIDMSLPPSSAAAAVAESSSFTSSSSSSSPPPDGWENTKYALAMWMAVASQDSKNYVDLLRAGYGDDVDGDDGDAADSNKSSTYGVYRELLKWSLGLSNHTFPSVVLGVIEHLKDTFVSAESDARFIAMAAELSANFSSLFERENAVLICNGYPRGFAPKHHSARLLSPDFAYLALFNALQLPAASVPVWLSRSQPLPLGVQVVAGWGRDDVALAVVEALAHRTPFCMHRLPQWIDRASFSVAAVDADADGDDEK